MLSVLLLLAVTRLGQSVLGSDEAAQWNTCMLTVYTLTQNSCEELLGKNHLIQSALGRVKPVM